MSKDISRSVAILPLMAMRCQQELLMRMFMIFMDNEFSYCFVHGFCLKLCVFPWLLWK